MRDDEHKQALPAGYQLKGYLLLEVLGVGGFGVTYLAEDVRLGRHIAIKEYLPNEFAMRDGETVHPKSRRDREDFQWGLERFLDEARTLARFRHPNLVRVLDYFDDNDTAYIVMDYERGESLDQLLVQHGKLTERQLTRLLLPIVDGLKHVHAAGYLHRDIKPSNVFVRLSDESPVLLDFGSARQALGRKSRSLTAVASAGYSPPEQYESEGEQGPWTDIYGLSALCYRAATGNAPVEAPRRMNRLAQRRPDPLPKLVDVRPDGYSALFLEAVDKGLEPIHSDRPPNLDAWVATLSESQPDAQQQHKALDRAVDSAVSAKVLGNATFQRRRVWVGVAATVVTGVTVLLAWTLWKSAPVGDDAGRRGIQEEGISLAGEFAGKDLLARDEQPSVRKEQDVVQKSVRLSEEAGPVSRGRLPTPVAQRAAQIPGGNISAESAAETVEWLSADRLARIPPPQPVAYGTLTLDLAPPDATVTLGDSSSVYRPEVRLPEGPHEVSVMRPGYRTSTSTVEVSGDTRERIKLDLLEPEGPAGMSLVWIPPGQFQMGSTSVDAAKDERPVTRVSISAGFWLGKYEVTQSEWTTLMGSNPSGFSGCERCPVERVSWEDVQEFLRRVNADEPVNLYRLPTEAEWEYAARAGTTEDRYLASLDKIAWHRSNSGLRTRPVGQREANAFGLYDMLGNVWEWVHDWQGRYSGRIVTDPLGPQSGSNRVYRGCSWVSDAKACRASLRYADSPAYRFNHLGFRLLRDMP